MQRLLEDKQFDLKPIAVLKNPSDILTKVVDRQTLERYFVILGLATLPDGGEKIAQQRAVSVASSTSWSVIARIAVMLGSLPVVKCTEVELVEKDYSLFYTVFVTIMVMMVSFVFWLGRATKQVKLTKKIEQRTIGTMTESTNPFVGPFARRVFTCRNGARFHIDGQCRTIQRSVQVNEWTVCGVCGWT